MTWSQLTVADDGTHHVRVGEPAYLARFDEVLPFHTPGLAPVLKDAQGWHIDEHGQAAYARRFARVFGFYEGLSAVVDSDGWHHITPHGDDTSNARFAWCGNCQGGRATVRDLDGCYYHVDGVGVPTYTNRWRYAGDYREGSAVIQAEDGQSTHIDPRGNLLHAQWFIDLDVFHKGLARARDADGWTHVDRAGRAAYSRRFANVEPFYNGQARAERHDGGLEIIDVAGRTLVELRAARRSEFAALSADMVGAWRTRTIAAAVSLGVPEALPATSGQIAAKRGLEPARLSRLLRALGELHIVHRVGNQWTLTDRGQYLRLDHPLTLADAALEYNGPLDELWRSLPAAVVGEPWTAPDIFAQVGSNAQRVQTHHRMLASYAQHDYAAVAAALPLLGRETVVDAGGAVGVLAAGLLRQHSDLRVVVLDRPEVVSLAASHHDTHRLSYVSADLFAPWNVTADAVILARVLHDWDDLAAATLLRHARNTLDVGGKVFVLEMLMLEDGVAGGLCDLHLLLATGGRERTKGEYVGLLDATGFDFQSVIRLPSLTSIIVGVAR